MNEKYSQLKRFYFSSNSIQLMIRVHEVYQLLPAHSRLDSALSVPANVINSQFLQSWKDDTLQYQENNKWIC